MSSSTGSRVVPPSRRRRRAPPGEFVEETGLADVGAGAPARGASLVGAGHGGLLGQHVEQSIEGVPGAATVKRRDRPWLAQTEVPERCGVGLAALVVDLVGDEDDRLAAAPQQLHDGLVVVGGPHRGIDDEEHGVRQVDGDLGLLGHAQVDAGRVDLPAAGIDQGEVAA